MHWIVSWQLGRWDVRRKALSTNLTWTTCNLLSARENAVKAFTLGMALTRYECSCKSVVLLSGGHGHSPFHLVTLHPLCMLHQLILTWQRTSFREEKLVPTVTFPLFILPTGLTHKTNCNSAFKFVCYFTVLDFASTFVGLGFIDLNLRRKTIPDSRGRQRRLVKDKSLKTV